MAAAAAAAAGFVSAEAGGGRAARALQTSHGTAGVCLPRGRRGQGGARPAGSGLLGNTAPGQDRAAGAVGAGQDGGWTALTISAVPTALRTPLRAPKLLHSRQCRGPEAERRAEPGPPATGAAADASPGGARGRDAWTRVRPPGRAGTGRTTRSWAPAPPAPAGSAGDRLAPTLPAWAAVPAALRWHARLAAAAARGLLFRAGGVRPSARRRLSSSATPRESRQRVPRAQSRRITLGRAGAWVGGGAGRDAEGAPGTGRKNRGGFFSQG